MKMLKSKYHKWYKEPYHCECGISLTNQSRSVHRKTKGHMNRMAIIDRERKKQEEIDRVIEERLGKKIEEKVRETLITMMDILTNLTNG